MSDVNIERLMMLYFEARGRKEYMAKAENFKMYIAWDYRLSGIADCIGVITNTPIEDLETKYSYLL